MERVAQSIEVALIHELVKYYFTKAPSPEKKDIETALEQESQEDDVYKSVKMALDRHGYYLGAKIVSRLTLGKGCIWDSNSCVILVCKDIWTYLFGFNASRLQSNGQGTYMILSDQITWINHVSTGLPKGVKDPQKKRQAMSNEYKMYYLHLIAGIIRGALASLGITAVVTPSIDGTYVFKVCLQS